MWKLQIPGDGNKWADYSEFVSGDAAKRKAAELRGYRDIERFRILDPGGHPWADGRWCEQRMKWRWL